MPPAVKKLRCPSCGKTLSAKTVRRHTRDWMGLCTSEQRRAARRAATLRHLLAREQRPAERPRSLTHRNRQDTTRHSNRLPFPRPASRAHPHYMYTGQSPHTGTPTPNDVRMGPSPPPGRTDFEVYMRSRAWHDDYALDTPGAGPSDERDPYAELQQFAAEQDQAAAARPPTLADHAEWLHGLSAQETLEQEIEAELARGGGKPFALHVKPVTNM